MLRLKEKYDNEIAPALKEQFQYKSVMEIPKLEKIVINMGLGEVKENPKAIESAVSDLTMITGQKPIVTKAKNPSPHSRCGKDEYRLQGYFKRRKNVCLCR